ncbi:high-affinity zinc uptake system protein ZnuA [Cellvibrio japonicus Ueda107]|uniref:High-affinity zinc uptake system protein ZnuA n=3 Tax=Cellvibrio japonicus TaxID=155077 RepID=B3PG27_CELJU|nr:high-affinity zinc uptake system protein ZnuA [Cellvibrio japonicus Ueda107]QEI13709.1 zinc ABC transporter substrate-binding protein [Cellvibrio japonicus]QEI17283.1 zinc ABC transporter substrate-binding protein [Cellvibrio japonicus]QEI20860.1 zinc ABC transporter substrate-binding protein [Cellvibrio japonicus]
MLLYNLSFYNRPMIAMLVSAFLKYRFSPAWLLALLLAAPVTMAKPRLLVSIKPLALIAQEVVGDKVTIDTLLPITASPHDYPLKVSDHKRIREADLVLWVGPALESFLAKPLRHLPEARQLSSYLLKGIDWPDMDDHSKHNHSHDHHHDDAHDPHLWLNPLNAAVIAWALAERLATLEPGHAAFFRQRATAFAESMGALDRELRSAMAPLGNVGFAVYHEGYSHFVHHYGLRQLAYVTFVPEQRPGARHLAELRRVMAEGGECIFSEPYQRSEHIDALAQQLKLRQGQLDAIGSEKITTYPELIRRMGQDFSACLAHR